MSGIASPTPLEIVRQLRAQEHCPDCGYLASAPGHRLCCGDPPPAPPWQPVSAASPTPLEIVRAFRAQVDQRNRWLTRWEIDMCPPCWEDECIACQGGNCRCACQDYRRPA